MSGPAEEERFAHVAEGDRIDPTVSSDLACRFGVWWNHKRKTFTTTRQAAWAAMEHFAAPMSATRHVVTPELRDAAFRTRSTLGVSSHPHDRAALDLDDVQLLAEFVHKLATQLELAYLPTSRHESKRASRAEHGLHG